MRTRPLLEMSVETLDAAIAAARGGADRVEICENLSIGGITPPESLMRAARQQIQIPIFAMIRPRGGNFVYSDAEFELMKRAIETAKTCWMDGVVLGILTGHRRVDVERTTVLASVARPLPVTFHRAFDELEHLEQGLDDVAATGASRILTSGGEASAEAGCSTLARLVVRAGKRIAILPGGGIRPSNLSRIARETRATEFHSGLSTMRPASMRSHSEFEAGVRELVRILEEEARNVQPASRANQQPERWA